jgi:hypothetical protein
MRTLGRQVKTASRVYLTGGASAVLLDLADVHEMVTRGLIEPDKLRSFFEAIQGRLFRYPAINPAVFRTRVERAIAAMKILRDDASTSA